LARRDTATRSSAPWLPLGLGDVDDVACFEFELLVERDVFGDGDVGRFAERAARRFREVRPQSRGVGDVDDVSGVKLELVDEFDAAAGLAKMVVSGARRPDRAHLRRLRPRDPAQPEVRAGRLAHPHRPQRLRHPRSMRLAVPQDPQKHMLNLLARASDADQRAARILPRLRSLPHTAPRVLIRPSAPFLSSASKNLTSRLLGASRWARVSRRVA
jgi:hypothetical protein